MAKRAADSRDVNGDTGLRCQGGVSGGEGTVPRSRVRGREASGARRDSEGKRLPADGRRAGINPLIDVQRHGRAGSMR